MKIKIIKRNVKNPRFEILGSKIFLILPINFNDEDYIKIFYNKKEWLNKKIRYIKKILKNNKDLLENFILFGEIIQDNSFFKDKKTMRKYLKNIKYLLKSKIENYTRYYSKKLKVNYNKIFIRAQKTKWGSCSSKGNLNFNILLAALPEKLIQYVVYHEMVHLIEKKHNNKFWEIIKKEFPEYRKYEEELNKYWILLVSNKYWSYIINNKTRIS